jgi:hypothetical protein
MKKIEFEAMENIVGGACNRDTKRFVSLAKDLSCAAAAFWPIGTLIGGPTCIGMLIASDACIE